MKGLLLLLVPAIGLLFFSCNDKETGTLDFSLNDIELITSGGADDMMRVYNYWIYSDSLVLRSFSSDITNFKSPYLDLLISRMLKTVKNPQNPGVGIAAPQVGINKRVIWVKRYDLSGNPFQCYLNARITQYSDTVKLRPDGCLSIPGVSASSYRAIWVDIEYNLADGSHYTERITHEYTAHIFQHEIDHLNGVVFLDRLVENRQQEFVILPSNEEEWIID
ncbi:MAG: peptide deformylase [Marinilabiliales bacterium]|nr:MAG: peptide deformylase [Marinilabiliales bacterium]